MSEEQKQPAFDAYRTFRIKHLTPEGIKTVEIKFPSDEDWCERESRRKSIIEFDAATGDPKTTRVEPDEDESELAKKLCPELEADLDPVEAGRLLDQLAFMEVAEEDEIVASNHLAVTLNVLQATTIHVFRMPTAKEMDKFQRQGCDQRSIAKRKVSSVKNLRMTQKLYEEMRRDVRGYVEGSTIPIIHQCAAVFAAFNALQTDLNTSPNP